MPWVKFQISENQRCSPVWTMRTLFPVMWNLYCQFDFSDNLFRLYVMPFCYLLPSAATVAVYTDRNHIDDIGIAVRFSLQKASFQGAGKIEQETLKINGDRYHGDKWIPRRCHVISWVDIAVIFCCCDKRPWPKVSLGRKSWYCLLVPEGETIMLQETWWQATRAESWESSVVE